MQCSSLRGQGTATTGAGLAPADAAVKWKCCGQWFPERMSTLRFSAQPSGSWPDGKESATYLFN
jgi:hypothetical protein